MIVLVYDSDSELFEYRINIRTVAGDESPTGFGFELRGKFVKSLGCIGGGIDADGDQLGLTFCSANCCCTLRKVAVSEGQIAVQVVKTKLTATTFPLTRSV